MERIASFCVDHTRLERGMYISRVDGDVVTYDIRMKKPTYQKILYMLNQMGKLVLVYYQH